MLARPGVGTSSGPCGRHAGFPGVLESVAVFAVTLAALGYALVRWHPAVLGLGAVVVLLLAPPNLGPLGELVAWVQGALESWFSGVM